MDNPIETHDLTKRFAGKAVVDRLTLAVPAGAIFALLGENGAGKTTTLRMLTGLLPADSGRAIMLGQDCWRAAEKLRGRVGYVPERPRLYDWMTVAEIGWFAAGFHAKGFLARYQDLAEKFALDPPGALAKPLQGPVRQGGPGAGPGPGPRDRKSGV